MKLDEFISNVLQDIHNGLADAKTKTKRDYFVEVANDKSGVSLPYRKYVLGNILVDLHEIGYARPPKPRKLFTTSPEKQPTVKLFRSSVSQKGPLYHRTNFLYGSEIRCKF